LPGQAPGLSWQNWLNSPLVPPVPPPLPLVPPALVPPVPPLFDVPLPEVPVPEVPLPEVPLPEVPLPEVPLLGVELVDVPLVPVLGAEGVVVVCAGAVVLGALAAPEGDGVLVDGCVWVDVPVVPVCCVVAFEAPFAEEARTSAPWAGLSCGSELGTTSVASWLLPQAPMARPAARVPTSARGLDMRKRIGKRVEAI
jgi:hypothetical protein